MADQLEPNSKPRTKAEALDMALKWGGEWSHWNLHAEVGEDRNAALAACAAHDAAEVQRLAALHSMLPDRLLGDYVRIERHTHDHVWHMVTDHVKAPGVPEQTIKVRRCGYDDCGALSIQRGDDEPVTYLEAAFPNARLVRQGEQVQ